MILLNHMQYKTFFLSEFDREMPNVRTMLERVPDDKFDWKPHDKSMKLGDLAAHIATLPEFAITIIETESLDMGNWTKEAYPTTRDGLLVKFDEVSSRARVALETMNEAEFEKPWSLLWGSKVVFSMPTKAEVMQNFFFNHLVHHRAQLGVYLRLLDIAIPGSYGPSADEQ